VSRCTALADQHAQWAWIPPPALPQVQGAQPARSAVGDWKRGQVLTLYTAFPHSGTSHRPDEPHRLHVLSVAVDRLTLDEAADRILGFATGSAPRQVVTVNPEFVMLARHHAAFKAVLDAADLATADGVGILLAARLFGDRLPERVGGVELLERVAARAARQGVSLFLLGAAEGVADRAGAALRARYPGLRIVGTYSGSPAPEAADAVIDRIRAAQPQILAVAFGAPQQDLWIARYRTLLAVPVGIGVGGAFDYLAGAVPRAPGWVQHAGFEWLYRLVRQPWRWRRMLALPRFAFLVIRQCSAERRRRAR
jgi:N-acetylglucosaminyldiphosphoundecaprenol N-acetyl-beta-D-mannosaminyltransferase